MSELLAIEGPLLSSLAGKKRSNDEAVGEIEEEVQVVAPSKEGATHDNIWHKFQRHQTQVKHRSVH